MLAPTIVGLPVLGEAVMVTRAVVGADRGRARALLGIRVDDPPPPTIPAGWWRRIRAMAGDRSGWKCAGYAFVLLFSGSAGFAAPVILAGGAAGLAYPAWRWLWPAQLGSLGTVTSAGGMAGVSAAGLVLIIIGAWAVRAVARMDAALVRVMLGPSRAVLARRIDDLQASRSAAVNLAAAERRRIERDLHDGVQARLVALAMDLGMARQHAESGGQGTAGMVAQAHEQAILAVNELRDVARGVHPAVLAQRGLDAAISALIAHAPFPVDVDVRLPERPPAVTESIAYFVIAEALTNAAKHSGATLAAVAVRPAGDAVIVEVTDNGAGGARVEPVGGLAGLQERLRTVDGQFSVSSPPGGPTLIRAEVPCAS